MLGRPFSQTLSGTTKGFRYSWVSSLSASGSSTKRSAFASTVSAFPTVSCVCSGWTSFGQVILEAVEGVGGGLVVPERAGFVHRVETAQAVADVPEVAQGGGEVALLDVGRHVPRLVVPDGIQEILEMVARAGELPDHLAVLADRGRFGAVQ